MYFKSQSGNPTGSLETGDSGDLFLWVLVQDCVQEPAWSTVFAPGRQRILIVGAIPFEIAYANRIIWANGKREGVFTQFELGKQRCSLTLRLPTFPHKSHFHTL